MRKLTDSARWNPFANVFMDHIVEHFKDGRSFTTSDVKKTITKKLEDEYTKCLPDWRSGRKYCYQCNWNLVQFDRVQKWLGLLDHAGVVDCRDKTVDDKFAGKCKYVYRLRDSYCEDEPVVEILTTKLVESIVTKVKDPDKVTIEERLARAEKRLTLLEKINKQMASTLVDKLFV